MTLEPTKLCCHSSSYLPVETSSQAYELQGFGEGLIRGEMKGPYVTPVRLESQFHSSPCES